MCSYFAEGGDLADIVRASGSWNSPGQAEQIIPVQFQSSKDNIHLFSSSNSAGDYAGSAFGLGKVLMENDEGPAHTSRPLDVLSGNLQISMGEITPQILIAGRRKTDDGSGGCLFLEQEGPQVLSPQALGCKRRKTQAKKVVYIAAPSAEGGRASGEAVPSDLWAWRKYGQKPIKGSPHPRGYYRCSSSKGCLARKQVERSRADPNMLVITYTSEHNHPWMTQRNSLAGSTRVRPANSNKQEPPTKEENKEMKTGDLHPVSSQNQRNDFFADLSELDALHHFDLIFLSKTPMEVEKCS